MEDRPKFKQPTSPAEVLRLGREFRKLRDTAGYHLLVDLLRQRRVNGPMMGVQSRDPSVTLDYLRGHMDEIDDILTIVDMAVMNGEELTRAIQTDTAKEFFGADASFPFQSGTGNLTQG